VTVKSGPAGGVTAIVTVAVELPVAFSTRYRNASLPVKFAAGVYVKLPSAFTRIVPFFSVDVTAPTMVCSVAVAAP